MIAVTETPNHIREFHEQLRGLIGTFIERLADSNSITINATYLSVLSKPTYIFIEQGIIHRLIDGRAIRTYIAGDLVLFEPDEQTLQILIDEDESVECKIYPESAMMGQILDSIELSEGGRVIVGPHIITLHVDGNAGAFLRSIEPTVSCMDLGE